MNDVFFTSKLTLQPQVRSAISEKIASLKNDVRVSLAKSLEKVGLKLLDSVFR